MPLAPPSLSLSEPLATARPTIASKNSGTIRFDAEEGDAVGSSMITTGGVSSMTGARPPACADIGAIAIAAIVAVTMSIRRFWRADHSKRWHYTVIGTAVIAFMIYEGTKDVIDILS